ncbi:MAG TPA: Xaa-Pro peptidase family protein [Candidatus Binataceae bacterium]|jgi:Xaa-Pro dipeptidase|nr:Xaa-Pro peptidase family protein [Candidatus Binataceae bacterium]
MSELYTARNPGTMAHEFGGTIDFERMRRERRERCLAEMERHQLDLLICGRDGNGRYLCGARRLWMGGGHGFGPSCVLVRETRELFLLSTWDDGIPAEIPVDHLYALSFNPMATIERIRQITPLAKARRIGVDAISPLFEGLIKAAAPNAVLVDGETAIRAARRIKTADEIQCIRTACAIAEAALCASIDALRPGVREADLLATFEQRMTAFNVTAPAVEGTFCATPRSASGSRGAPLRQLSGDRSINEGDLVALSSGVLYAGYEGSVGRTWPCMGTGSEIKPAQRALFQRWSRLWEALRSQLRPGNSGAALRKAYEDTGEPLPPFPIANGIGMGWEPPLIGTALGAQADSRAILEPGMVLTVQGYVWQEGIGSYLGKETVAITADGCEVITRLGHGPLSE